MRTDDGQLEVFPLLVLVAVACIWLLMACQATSDLGRAFASTVGWMQIGYALTILWGKE